MAVIECHMIVERAKERLDFPENIADYDVNIVAI